MLRVWKTKKSCRRKDLESLLGHLSHAPSVVRPGRTFLWKLFTLLHGTRAPHHFTHLSAGARADLAWWWCFLQSWNGSSLFPSHSFFSLISPSYVTIVIRCSKNDPFVVGAKLHLGRTGLPLCPVSALLCYLAIQPSQHGPLFLFKDGSTLSRPRLVMSLRKALSDAGVDPSGYNGHSFWIGTATTVNRMRFLYRLWVDGSLQHLCVT